VPTVVVVTQPFETLAHHSARAYELPSARIAVIPHPLGGIPEGDVDALAAGAVAPILELLGHG
jgi:hypothetical protein